MHEFRLCWETCTSCIHALIATTKVEAISMPTTPTAITKTTIRTANQFGLFVDDTLTIHKPKFYLRAD